MPHWFPRLFAFGLAAALCAAIAAPLSAEPTAYGDPKLGEQLFFEHSFGASFASVPFKVFEALPDLAPGFSHDALHTRYGLLYKPGRTLPIGFVKAPAAGMDRLSFNCSLCHTGVFHGQLWPGLPNPNLRVQDFQEDLIAALGSKAVTADTILPHIKARHPNLSWAEEAQLRLWFVAAKWQLPSMKPSPHRAGPGRFDLIQTFKVRLGLPPHPFNANADIPALFEMSQIKRYPRDGALGGDQDLVRYLIVRLAGDNSPLKDGKAPQWVHDLNSYLYTLEPPKYPYPIDRAKAADGHRVFLNTCAQCHGTYAPDPEVYPNRLVPISVVGTDPQRVEVWDQAAIAYTRRDPIMRKLDLQPGVGIVPPSLRGVWATAPYLHNGSVPTIHAMLSDPASRPKRFWVGGEHFDPRNVGLSTVERPADASQFLFDTTIPGNGNQGHPFGMPLTEDERMAVIEYLKTL